MRLLDVHSVSEDKPPVFHELLENGSASPLRYAILSHTWGKGKDDKEIVFDDIPSSENFAKFFDEETQLKQWQTAIRKKKIGFAKVSNACKVAHELGMDYIWVDSCCIDKSKPSELNESINSMYRWYQNSEMCIAYLEDLEPGGDFRPCRWFKRGWTLQELIAPPKVLFFNKAWTPFGERSDTVMCPRISSITGISERCLQGLVKPDALSIAHRVSWANGRETTVPEDHAYSLLGIFDINMPLIYGEGGKNAFIRLQDEIIKNSSDLSIFAWDPIPPAETVLDAFASTPNHFANFKDVVPSYQSQHFTRTNKGLEMKTVLRRIGADGKERLMLPLGKQRIGKCDIGMILRKVGHNMYMRRGRIQKFSVEAITASTSTAKFYLTSPHISTCHDQVLDTSRERAIVVPSDLGDYIVENTAPQYTWDCEDRLFFNNQHWGGSDWRALGLVNTRSVTGYERRFIALFVVNDGTPMCYLLRWRQELGFLFRRRHQTKTTRLEEFRHIVQGATNKIEMLHSRGTLFLTLIPKVTSRGGKEHLMDLKMVPWPLTQFSSSSFFANETAEIFGKAHDTLEGSQVPFLKDTWKFSQPNLEGIDLDTLGQETAPSALGCGQKLNSSTVWSEEGTDLRVARMTGSKKVISQYRTMNGLEGFRVSNSGIDYVEMNELSYGGVFKNINSKTKRLSVHYSGAAFGGID